MIANAAQWVLRAQNSDGGWGGDKGVASSIEETALAVEALARLAINARRSAQASPDLDNGQLRRAVQSGAGWLIRKTRDGQDFPPSPIGLYFASLWYSEKLYPLIFTVAALELVRIVDQ